MLHEGLFKNSMLKKHFGWKLAICQHPMYLLIDEDRGEPFIGERIAPWGAPDAEEYVKRVERNLDSLEKFPDLQINYEFSSVEIEGIAERFPKVIKKMKKMYDEGKLDFVNGSFSQPHLQVFGSESSWRQFEMGLEVYERLFGKKVTVYEAQETGLHLQLPQILKKFGYDFIVLPFFPWTIETLDGKTETYGCMQGSNAINGDEFVFAESPDGSSIPVYVNDHETNQEYLEKEIIKDMYSGQQIWLHSPDMIEVDDEFHEKYSKLFDFILLEEVLKEKIKKVTSHTRVLLYTYWSYNEGIWSQEPLLKNKQCEEMAVLSESISCMARLTGSDFDSNRTIKDIWHRILKYQHHDIYWCEVTDLRRKAIDNMDIALGQSVKVMEEASRILLEDDTESIAVFNGLTAERRCIIEVPEGSVPQGSFVSQEYNGRYFGTADLPAFAYKSFKINGKPVSKSYISQIPKEIDMGQYRISFTDSGLIRQVSLASGEKLLKPGEYEGGEIRCVIDDIWVDNRKAECRFFEGDVAWIMERNSSLGDIPLTETYFFYKQVPFIKVEVDFHFNGNEVGNFWIDESKINIYYPTSDVEIYHDIPYGYIQGKEKRPLFATNWLYCGGLAYINRGTVKHWVKDGVIANVVAWGGDIFDNRLTHRSWMSILADRQYDIKLYGNHKIEYFLLPVGKFDGNRIVKEVDAMTFPVFMAKGKGNRSFHDFKNKDITVTSIYENKGTVHARGYKLPSDDQSVFKDWEIFNVPIERL